MFSGAGLSGSRPHTGAGHAPDAEGSLNLKSESWLRPARLPALPGPEICAGPPRPSCLRRQAGRQAGVRTHYLSKARASTHARTHARTHALTRTNTRANAVVHASAVTCTRAHIGCGVPPGPVPGPGPWARSMGPVHGPGPWAQLGPVLGPRPHDTQSLDGGKTPAPKGRERRRERRRERDR